MDTEPDPAAAVATPDREKLKVQVWIYLREGASLRVLLLQTRPERGSFWQPVTGSVDGDEDLPTAALREAREETGLEFLSLPTPLEYEFSFEKDGQRVRESVFGFEAAHGDSGLPALTLDPNEHVDAKWATPAEALMLTQFPSNVRGLRILLRRLGLETA